MRVFAIIHSSLFLAVVLVLAVVSATRVQSLSVPDATEFRVGEAARGFERHYDAVFPAKTFGINFWAAVQYLAFGEGRNGVVVGSDDWLYTTEEFRDWPDADRQIDRHLNQVVEVREQLAQRGTELVVALVPAKASLYAEHLGERQPEPLHHDLYERTLDGLGERGVRVADLRAALAACKKDGAVFLRTDTHWTPQGARCAAQAIAKINGPAAADRWQAYVTELEPEREFAGDLTNFLPLTPYFATLMPQPDRIAPMRTRGGESGLLDDAPLPEIVLVGTSYSANPLWNFDGALRAGLGEDVLNLADSGKGPFVPMQSYLQNPDSPQARVLIWEIPVRYLPMDDPSAAQKASTTPTEGETA